MINVVAAAIRDSMNRILIAKRPDHVHKGGLWEFPGGKSESAETREQALVRELHEELGLNATVFRPLIRIPHHYPDKSVLLDVWEVTGWQGEPHGKEGQPIEWVDADRLHEYDFPEANLPIITACRLPTHYLITPALEGDKEHFLQQLSSALANGIKLVQLRQKDLSVDEFESLAQQVIKVCHDAGARVLLNAAPEMVIRLNADGVQLNASGLMGLDERPLPESYLVAASCHDEYEIRKACDIGIDFMVLSPVQATASHPGALPLGWQRFSELTERSTIPVYALGGVSKEQIEMAWQHGGQGISAIRALWSSS
ncbi:MAG: Nudix family hydrolase [Gammaproteobacteria bacterium]|nr:MAG: Nudix family hydrolase [Gammaproteobacteria bacterium]